MQLIDGKAISELVKQELLRKLPKSWLKVASVPI